MTGILDSSEEASVSGHGWAMFCMRLEQSDERKKNVVVTGHCFRCFRDQSIACSLREISNEVIIRYRIIK